MSSHCYIFRKKILISIFITRIGNVAVSNNFCEDNVQSTMLHQKLIKFRYMDMNAAISLSDISMNLMKHYYIKALGQRQIEIFDKPEQSYISLTPWIEQKVTFPILILL